MNGEFKLLLLEFVFFFLLQGFNFLSCSRPVVPVETKRRLFTVSGNVLFINEQGEGKTGKKRSNIDLKLAWC